jgi:hypothetical protein
MNRLLVLSRFADDSQGVLTAILWFTGMRGERFQNLVVRSSKRGIAPLTDCQPRFVSNDAKFSGTHENSLAPDACAKETAPVPAV